MIRSNPSEECFAKYYKEFGSSKDQVERDVILLKNWYSQQPHLPQVLQNDWLFRYTLHRCKMSVERTKQALDVHFTLKSALPEYFTNRDPMLPEIQRQMDLIEVAPLPHVTAEGYRIFVYKLLPPDAKYTEIDFQKLLMLSTGCREPTDLTLGDVYIMDMEGICMEHVKGTSLAQLKKAEVCYERVFGGRLKGVHFINSPPVMKYILQMAVAVARNKRFFSSKLFLHSTLDTLYDHFDREVLPEDFGGKQRKLSELWADWRSEIESRRGWFMDQEAMRVDESKRKGQTIDKNELFGFEGTFKQLSVD